MTDDEDLIESDVPSAISTGIKRRLDLVIPETVGRKVMGSTVIAALTLGLVGGFFVGKAPDQDVPNQSSIEAGPPPGGVYVPLSPEGSPLEHSVAVRYVGAATLTIPDLAGIGEAALSVARGLVTDSGLDGLCDIAGPSMPAPLPRGPVLATIPSFGYAAFLLAGASLTERIVPYFDELAASAQLNGMVDVAQSCASSDGLSVRTDGVMTGIGDEYAVFNVIRPDVISGEIETSIVVLVRVGVQIIEISLSPVVRNEVTDGLARVMGIAEVAAGSILTG